MIRLSAMQRRAIEGFANDKTAGELAEEFGCSPRTLHEHIRIAKLKLGINTLHGLTAYCVKWGLVKVENK